MSIEVESQGKTFTFPDGTTNDQIGAAVDEYFGAQQAPALAVPEPTAFESLKEAVTGSQRQAALPEAVQQLPELASVTSPVTTGEFGSDIQIAAGLLTSFDPKARMDIIRDAVPGVEFEQVNDTTVVKLPNGQQAVLNAPGLSQSDIVSGIAQVLAFSPAGRIGALGRNLAQRVGLGAVTSGATEAALQGASKALGSEQEIDKGQIATAAGLGPVAELGTAAVTGGKRLVEASKQAIPEQVANALDKGLVFTSDLFEPDSFLGANLQRLAEKIPVIGTGPIRSIQQNERVQAVRDLAGEFDVDIDSSFEEDIISSATKVFEGAQKRAKTFRKDAVKELVKGGEVDVNNAKAVVADEIAKQKGLGDRASQPLIKSLESIEKELSGDFKRIGDIRTTIHNEISDINKPNNVLPSSAEAILNNVRSAITSDMKSFAGDFSKQAREEGDKLGAKALSKWNASNRIFADGFQKAKDTQLKKVLSKGEATPEVVLTTIRGGKVSDLNRLNTNLDAGGKQAVRQTIIRDALDKATKGGVEEVNPTIFINELNRKNNRKATKVFFKGNAGKELEGLKLFLNSTKRAQQAGTLTPTGQELLAPATGILLGVSAPVSAPVLGTIAGGARIFESPTVRDLMIKLGQTSSKEGKEKLIRKLQPLILEESRRLNAEDK